MEDLINSSGKTGGESGAVGVQSRAVITTYEIGLCSIRKGVKPAFAWVRSARPLTRQGCLAHTQVIAHAAAPSRAISSPTRSLTAARLPSKGARASARNSNQVSVFLQGKGTCGGRWDFKFHLHTLIFCKMLCFRRFNSR